MFYREAGQFKTSYQADQAVFPMREDRVWIGIVLAVAAIIIPLFGSDYFLEIVMINFLFFSLAAIGLNILTGYTGQISLGTGGFMAVGAVSSYKLGLMFPDLNIIIIFVLSGFFAAAVGIVFGMPSLRIKGFYLAVATLAAQFFLDWLFLRVDWFTNSSNIIEGLPRSLFGIPITGPGASPQAKYYVALGFVVVFALARQEPGARAHRPRVDGDPRHGHRRRDHRHPAAADQAARLRHQFVLLRRRRQPDAVPLLRQRGAGPVRHQPVVPRAVHDHHRRAGQHPRLVHGRRVRGHGADRPDQRCCPTCSTSRSRRTWRSTSRS